LELDWSRLFTLELTLPLLLLFLQEIISYGIAFAAEILAFRRCGGAENSG
jgi:hypothetical protein